MTPVPIKQRISFCMFKAKKRKVQYLYDESYDFTERIKTLFD